MQNHKALTVQEVVTAHHMGQAVRIRGDRLRLRRGAVVLREVFSPVVVHQVLILPRVRRAPILLLPRQEAQAAVHQVLILPRHPEEVVAAAQSAEAAVLRPAAVAVAAGVNPEFN